MFAVPAFGMAVKVVCDAGKNSGCEMPMPLRACTTTPEIPLPATRIVQMPGSGRLMTTIC